MRTIDLSGAKPLYEPPRVMGLGALDVALGACQSGGSATGHCSNGTSNVTGNDCATGVDNSGSGACGAGTANSGGIGCRTGGTANAGLCSPTGGYPGV